MNIAELLVRLQQPEIQKMPMAPENSALRALLRDMGHQLEPMWVRTPKMSGTLEQMFPNEKYIDPEQLMRIERLKREGKLEWFM